MKATFN